MLFCGWQSGCFATIQHSPWWRSLAHSEDALLPREKWNTAFAW
jgi:hypothetical protein